MILERHRPAPAPVRTPVRPQMAERRSRARQVRQLQKRNPMTFVVLLGACLATLVVLYLSSYAGVTARGYRLAKMESHLRKLERRDDYLRSEMAKITNPGAIAALAKQAGMVRDGGALRVEPTLTARVPDDRR